MIKPGDVVFWNDPNNGECSRLITVRAVHVHDEEAEEIMYTLTDADGETVQGYAHEFVDASGFAKLSEEALDDLVHDAFSSMASNLNNEGREAQISWLVKNGYRP